MVFSSKSVVMVFPLVSVSVVRGVETVMTAPVISKGLIWLLLITEEMLPVMGIEISGFILPNRSQG